MLRWVRDRWQGEVHQQRKAASSCSCFKIMIPHRNQTTVIPAITNGRIVDQNILLAMTMSERYEPTYLLIIRENDSDYHVLYVEPGLM